MVLLKLKLNEHETIGVKNDYQLRECSFAIAGMNSVHYDIHYAPVVRGTKVVKSRIACPGEGCKYCEVQKQVKNEKKGKSFEEIAKLSLDTRAVTHTLNMHLVQVFQDNDTEQPFYAVAHVPVYLAVSLLKELGIDRSSSKYYFPANLGEELRHNLFHLVYEDIKPMRRCSLGSVSRDFTGVEMVSSTWSDSYKEYVKNRTSVEAVDIIFAEAQAKLTELAEKDPKYKRYIA